MGQMRVVQAWELVDDLVQLQWSGWPATRDDQTAHLERRNCQAAIAAPELEALARDAIHRRVDVQSNSESQL